MTESVSTGQTENELISLARLSKALGPVDRETSQSQTDKTGRGVGHASTDPNVHRVDLRLTSVMRSLVLSNRMVLRISSSLVARANQSLPFTQTKAANLARMRAECMYETGALSCLASNPRRGSCSAFREAHQGGNRRSHRKNLQLQQRFWSPGMETECWTSPTTARCADESISAQCC